MSRRYLPIVVILAAILSGAASWVVSKPVDVAAGWRIERVALSESGRWIAVGSASGWIGIIDQMRPDSPQRFRGGAGALRDLRFSTDEQWLFVRNDAWARHPVSELGSLEAVARPGGEAQAEGEWSGQHSSNVATSGGVMVFGNAAGSIEVHDSRSGAMLRRFTFR